MKTTATWGLIVVGASMGLAACGQAKSATPPPANAPAATSVTFAEPSASLQPATEAGRCAATSAARKPALKPPVIKFTDARKQTREFIGYFRSITLTPEQERIKVEALSALPRLLLEVQLPGGCKRPNAKDGCGGMDEAQLL